MDSSGYHDGQRRQDCNGRQQWQWATVAQWAAGRQSNLNGLWGGGGAMDGTMGGRQLPVDEGTKMGAMLEVFGWLVCCEIWVGLSKNILIPMFT